MPLRRILITTGIFAPDIGGPASYGHTLGTRLAEQGIEVTLLTYSSVRSYKGDSGMPFRVHRIWTGLPWGLRHVLYMIRAWQLVRHVDEILALNAVSAGVPAACVARLTRKPLILRIAGDYAWEIAIQTGRTFLMINEFQKTKKSGRVKRLSLLQAWSCRQAAVVIVPSQYLAGLVSGWGIDAGKIHIIYNGVNMLNLEMTKEVARRQIGISGNIIFSSGRLVPWKGFRMLIKLMPQLLQVNQFFRLVIAGDGPDMSMLQSVVRTLGLERKVYLVGRKSAHEIAQYLAAADMFVLNTGYEGFSHQVLEAMGAGVPVVTTTAGGNREVVIPGHNGLMVRYNDEFNLLEAIKALWNQPELRERIITNARQTAGAFNVERMYEQTLTILQYIIK